MKIKEGDVVGRRSYNNDILFVISRIIKINTKKFAILKGVSIRIEADAPLEDLELIDKRVVNENIKAINNKLSERVKNYHKRVNGKVYTGKILHLDGDKRYSEKSLKYYNKIGLNAVVKNIPESKQPNHIRMLLEKYKPDILIITGHDSMLKNGTNYYNIYNYRNSKYFVSSVREARKWQYSLEKLSIFAGACQSFFEAIMEAGANFASSPGRILIDFIDPIIIAEKIATTENHKFVTTTDIIKEIKEGSKGVGGIGAMGKKKLIIS